MASLNVSANTGVGQQFTIKIVTTGALLHFNPNSPLTWRIASTNGTVTNFHRDKFKVDTSVFTVSNANYGGFFVQQTGANIELQCPRAGVRRFSGRSGCVD